MKTYSNYLKSIMPLFLTMLFLSFGINADAQKYKDKKMKKDKSYIKTTEKGTAYELIGWQEEVVYNPHTFTWFAWEEPIIEARTVERQEMVPVSAFTRPPVFTGETGNCLAVEDKFTCSNQQLQEYIARKNVEYPQPAQAMEQEGLEYVTFTLNEEGKFEGNLKVMSKEEPCAGCADKAADIVAEMEDMWYPAIKDGKAVKTELTIPVRFEIIDN